MPSSFVEKSRRVVVAMLGDPIGPTVIEAAASAETCWAGVLGVVLGGVVVAATALMGGGMTTLEV